MKRAAPGGRGGVGKTAARPRGWQTWAVHHGLRLLVLMVVAVAVYLLFPAPRVPDTAVLERGVVAPQDVIAEFGFEVPKRDDELQRERDEAAAAVPAVYDYAPGAPDSVLASVRTLFSRLDSVARATPPAQRADVLRAVLERQRLAASEGALAVLQDDERRLALWRATEAVLREQLPRGVIAAARLREPSATLQVRHDGRLQALPMDSVLSADRLYQLAAERLPASVAPDATELQRLLLIRYVRPTLVRNDSATAAARARARAAVDTIAASVLPGERVVGAHEQIGEREEVRLRAYQAALAERGLQPGSEATLTRALGAVLFNTMVLGVFGLLLLYFRRPQYDDLRGVLVFAALTLSVAAAAALIARFELPPELIPVPFAALLVAVLWEGRLALAFSLVLALLLAGQSPFLGISAPFAAAMGGAAAAIAAHVIERRSRTWLFISVVALTYAAAALAMGLMRTRGADEILASIGWGAVNAVVASILAIGFLPLLEGFTRITTGQTLLELSDLNRTLLKRLSLEAPGTYAHTISVANLAEAACHAIGANGLLARVGTYYHDIGKLAKPQYFVENQPRGRNPHDKLKPGTSASIIRSHVADGLRLAEEARLPAVVKRFIVEHHGTQSISFFLDRAREADPNAAVNPAEFAYPGPRPQTKETAILMLADSVESAARVLPEPTPSRIRELVERIVNAKIAAGQLDECPLTLRELDLIKEQLAKVLGGMYHHRIDYPPSTAPATHAAAGGGHGGASRAGDAESAATAARSPSSAR